MNQYFIDVILVTGVDCDYYNRAENLVNGIWENVWNMVKYIVGYLDLWFKVLQLKLSRTNYGIRNEYVMWRNQ